MKIHVYVVTCSFGVQPSMMVYASDEVVVSTFSRGMTGTTTVQENSQLQMIIWKTVMFLASQ
jgi:hypothetical protein